MFVDGHRLPPALGDPRYEGAHFTFMDRGRPAAAPEQRPGAAARRRAQQRQLGLGGESARLAPPGALWPDGAQALDGGAR